MPLLIDGHNLIGRLPDIGLDDPDDEARLVSLLQAFAGRTRKRITVVFDRGLPGGRSDDLSAGRVEVVFAPTGRNADRVLIERIRDARSPAGLTVVTSDREVIAVAKERGAHVVRSETFLDDLDPAPARPTRAKADDVHLSSDQIDAWLDLFRSGES